VDIANHNVGAEIEIFVREIMEGSPITMDAREGARTVAACLGAVVSSQSGKLEEIPDF